MAENVNSFMLQELADELGVQVAFVEKDYVLTQVVYHYSHSDLGQQFILKGGQALRHIYRSPHLSKDVDFVATRRIEFEDLPSLMDIRYPRLRVPDAPAGLTRRGFKLDPIQYRSITAGGGQDNIAIEISFREDLVLAPDTKTFESHFLKPFPVQVLNVNEMVAEKCRALYQRGNPRDLYDLWYLFGGGGQVAEIDSDQVAELIPMKFKREFVASGWDYARLYGRMLEEEKTWSTLADLIPDPPPFDEAMDLVQKALRFLKQAK